MTPVHALVCWALVASRSVDCLILFSTCEYCFSLIHYIPGVLLCFLFFFFLVCIYSLSMGMSLIWYKEENFRCHPRRHDGRAVEGRMAAQLDRRFMGIWRRKGFEDGFGLIRGKQMADSQILDEMRWADESIDLIVVWLWLWAPYFILIWIWNFDHDFFLPIHGIKFTRMGGHTCIHGYSDEYS
jgi:hypothetical protein